MALRKLVERLTKPVDELDRDELRAFCTKMNVTPIDQVELRRPTRVVGEVRSLRIVPRAGADALEVTINDGHASLTGVFLGRRKIVGVMAGRRVVFEGVITLDGRQRQMFNPIYTLL